MGPSFWPTDCQLCLNDPQVFGLTTGPHFAIGILRALVEFFGHPMISVQWFIYEFFLVVDVAI